VRELFDTLWPLLFYTHVMWDRISRRFGNNVACDSVCHNKPWWCLSELYSRQQGRLLLLSAGRLRDLSTVVISADRHIKKVKVAHTRLPSVGFRSWSRFLAASLQVTWVINPAVGCHYFSPDLQLPPQLLRGLLPVLLLGEQRHNGCEHFA